MDLFVFLTSFLILWMVVIVIRKSKPVKLPPGPMPLPIIGNLHQVYPLPHRILTNMAKKYGPVMYLKLGEVSTVVVSSAEFAEEVMKDHDVIFSSRPRFLFSTILNYNCQDITFSPYNASWRQLRKICNLEILNAKRVQSFRPIREAELMNMMKSIASQKGSAINMTRLIFSMTYTIIARCAFGKRSEHHDRYLTVMLDVSKVMGVFNLVYWYPSVKILERITGIRNKLGRMQKGIDETLETIISEHVRKRVEPKTGNEEEKEDPVDVLLNILNSRDLGAAPTYNNVKGAIYVS